MKKFIIAITTLCLAVLVIFNFTACGGKGNSNENAETIELAEATIGEISFENSEAAKLEQDGSLYTISGKIDAMSAAQKNAFGVDGVTHVVCVKFTFDKEKTISSFKVQGDVTKVYSDNDSDEFYSGSLSELLDNEGGEDAYCNLILSASTKEYKLVSTYTDKSSSTITLKINATLATAKAN